MRVCAQAFQDSNFDPVHHDSYEKIINHFYSGITEKTRWHGLSINTKSGPEILIQITIIISKRLIEGSP